MKRIRRILLCILMITVLCGISIVGNSVVKSENKSKEKKRTAITKEEMKEWDAPDEEILEYYDLGKFFSTLPVIYMNTMGQQILKENAIWGNIALLDGNEEDNLFSLSPIRYTVLRSNTEEHLLIANLIKSSIALNFIKIKKTVQKKYLLQEWEQTVNGY